MPDASLRRGPDAREVDRVEAVVASEGSAADWPRRCLVDSAWTVRIRTAEVRATLIARAPLGTFDEATCLCLSLRLELPVPVEPGLRFQLELVDDPSVRLSGVVRPWGG